MRRVVVLGAGAAGFSAAEWLTGAFSTRPGTELILINRSDHHVVRPLLPELFAQTTPPRMALVNLHGLTNRGPVSLRLEGVTRVDAAASMIHTERGECPYDYLLIALGHKPALPADWRGLYHFDNDVDAVRLRHALEELGDRGGTVAVVGGGPQGVELAALLTETGRCRVHLFEQEPQLLPEFPDEFGAYAERVLLEDGVTIEHTTVTHVDDGHVTFEGGERQVDFVVWAGGGQPPTCVEDLAIGSGLSVDAFLRVEGHTRVFVAGALANQAGAEFPQDINQAAHMGRVAAKNLLAAMTGRAPETYRDQRVLLSAAVGRRRAVGLALGLPLWGFPAWVARSAALLRAMPHLFNQLGWLTKEFPERLRGGRKPS